MSDHSERITITDALGWDCIEGECEHSDEADMNDFENCPKITIDVCVDCMEERGHGRDPQFWEELVSHREPPEPGTNAETRDLQARRHVHIRGDAMSDDYTPTTQQIRDAWWSEQCAKPDLDFDDIYNAAFDRWLAAHDAEVRAAVLAEQGEPEWEYALIADGDDEPWSNYYKTREHLAGQCGGLMWREDEHLVRRRLAGPWVPVEDPS